MAAWERPDVCKRMKKTRRYDLGQKRKDKACVQLKKKNLMSPSAMCNYILVKHINTRGMLVISHNTLPFKNQNLA
jgi:hypothetical protein